MEYFPRRAPFRDGAAGRGILSGNGDFDAQKVHSPSFVLEFLR
jgi:hypothetical protein